MLTFNEQSLVCFLQHSDKVPRHHLFFDVQDIKHVISFERNPRGQIYVTQELESAIHGTLPTSFCINELYSKHLPTNVPVTYTHVGKDSNYFSKDNRFCVLNKGVESSDEIDIIQACQGLVITMFEDGHLADSFSYKEKKRASTPSSLAIDNLNCSVLDELVVTDTIPLQENARKCEKIRQLSIAEMLAEAMYRISNEESVSSLYMD